MSANLPEPEIKKISVTGGNEVFGGISQPKRSSKSRKNLQTAGNINVLNETIISDSPTQQIKRVIATTTPSTAAAVATNMTISQEFPADKKQKQSAAMPVTSLPTPTAVQPTLPLEGGNVHQKRPIKVVLNKSKITHKAVKLNPKKPISVSQEINNPTNHKTKKARKITLGISGLKRRITIAQKIRSKTSKMPIDALRADLISKGLLKSGSKTPDDLVRQIASDAQILNKKVL